MLPGRVGDSPLIGAGVYADNRSGAVSMTGEGEAIIRAGLAKEITLRMEFGQDADTAAKTALRRMGKRTGGSAGALVIASDGEFAILHTTPQMIAGYRAGRRQKVSSFWFQVSG
jgi:beta-aspartyl-peptidase (threonine type)